MMARLGEIFSIGRFLPLLVRNVDEYMSRNRLLLLIYVVLDMIFLTSKGMDGRLLHEETYVFMALCWIVTVMVYYWDINLKGSKLLDFIMLPASAFEKFLSINFVTFLFAPMLIFIVSWLLASVFAEIFPNLDISAFRFMMESSDEFPNVLWALVFSITVMTYLNLVMTTDKAFLILLLIFGVYPWLIIAVILVLLATIGYPYYVAGAHLGLFVLIYLRIKRIKI